MPHARIINTEFKSKEDLELSIIAWQKWSPDNMPAGMLSGDHFCHAIIDNSRSSLDLNSVFIIRAWGI